MSGEVWDTLMPGAGAQRVCAIAQLYFRMINYGPLTTLVVDALCNAFNDDGATILELSNYLGVQEDRVLMALETIPLSLRVTSLELENEVQTLTEDNTSNFNKLSRKRSKTEEVRYYINYKRLLPLAYAHVSYMLLALCQVPLPTTSLLEKTTIQSNTLTSAAPATTITTTTITSNKVNNDNSSSASNSNDKHIGDYDTNDIINSTLNISAMLRRSEATCGVCCKSCRSYFALEEFAPTLRKCPMCNGDVLSSILTEIVKWFDHKLQNKEALITPLPQVRAALELRRTKNAKSVTMPNISTNNSTLKDHYNANEENVNSSSSSNINANSFLPYALASDPLLVQQALAFFYLYSVKFAYVTDARNIINPEEILTELEYLRRIDGKASIADQFRACHRNARSIRVKVIDQAVEDMLLRRVNAEKIAKRSQLPPWLRHQPLMHSNSKKSNECGNNNNYSVGEEQTFSLQTEKPAWQSPTKHASEKQRNNVESLEKENSALLSISNKRRRLQYNAQYIASEFYNNDYDLVAS